MSVLASEIPCSRARIPCSAEIIPCFVDPAALAFKVLQLIGAFLCCSANLIKRDHLLRVRLSTECPLSG